MRNRSTLLLAGLVAAMLATWFIDSSNLASEDRTEQNRTEQNRTEQNTNTLYCPHIKYGLDWQTSVQITNIECSCKQKRVRVKLSTHDNNGTFTGTIKNVRKLKANETKVIDPQSLPPSAASLKIAPNGNLISHVIYRTNDGKKSEVVPAVKAPSMQLDFPVLADYEDVFIYETITLLNPNPTPASIEMIALDKNGYEIERMAVSPLSSWESNTIALVDIFGPKTLKDLSTVRVVSDTNIAGIQLVDYPGNDLVGLPALTVASKGWTFPIATEGGNQALWTRVGVINPGGETADISVEAFDASNNSLGAIDRKSLLPGAIYFTGTENTSTDGGVIPLNAAYIKVTADRPISGFEVVGVIDGSGLAAVMGIPEEDLTAVGFEITGTNDSGVLNAYLMVRMEDGSVKSTAMSLENEEWNKVLKLIMESEIAGDFTLKKDLARERDAFIPSYYPSDVKPCEAKLIKKLEKKGAKVIYLNPSNEKKPVCTQGTGCGEWECYDERKVADKVADMLYAEGYSVIVDYDQYNAGKRANEESTLPNVFVSIHSNATTEELTNICKGKQTGPETWWENSNTGDETLSLNIQNALVAELRKNEYKGNLNRGIKDWNKKECRNCDNDNCSNPKNCKHPMWPNWYEAKMPACLVETLFHDNPEDAYILCSKAEIVAQGIADGIITFLTATPPPSPFLSFPLRGKNAYNAEIISVFDHSMKKKMRYCPDNVKDSLHSSVIAYTGEKGTEPNEKESGKSGTNCPGHKIYSFFKSQDDKTPFYINGHYVGTKNSGPNTLNYDGHPGYDYNIEHVDGKDVLAAGTGTVIVADWENTENHDKGLGLRIIIDHNNGYRTIYGHLSSVKVQKNDKITTVGQVIGEWGSTGNSGGRHLHFEVRTEDDISVDPYGWDQDKLGDDPYTLYNPGVVNYTLWVTTAILPKITSISPTSGVSGTSVTINGTNFGTTQGTVKFGTAEATVTSWSDTKIVATAPAGTGTVNVTVTTNAGTSNGVPFAYTTVTIIFPNGGEHLLAGSEQTIEWKVDGDTSQIKDFLVASSIDGGTNYTAIGTVTATDRFLSKKIPSYVLSTQCKVAVVAHDASGRTLAGDASDNNFTISKCQMPGTFTLTASPGCNGSSSQILLSWTGSSDATSYDLYRNGSSYKTGLNGTQYTDKSVTSGTIYTYYVTAKNSCGSTKSNTASATANDCNTTFTVTYPNGGETWQTGSTQKVTWTYKGDPGPNVKIELLKGGAWNYTIASSTSIGSNGSGSYIWTVPKDQASGSDYKIRITSTNVYTDTSDGNFTIGGTIPSIASINPMSGTAGTSVTINGKNFGTTQQGTSTIKFGIATATVTSWSDTKIVAIAPTNSGTVNVTVTTTSGTSNGIPFTYNENPPHIDSVSPNPVIGSNSPQIVTLYGQYFASGLTVTVGWTGGSKVLSSSQVFVDSSTQVRISITTTTDPDTWTVKVTNPDGQSSNTAYFQVIAPPPNPPHIDSVSPNPVIGSNSPQIVTLYGQYFASGLTVTVGWTGGSKVLSSSQVFVDSSTQVRISITTTTDPDTWTVKVTNPDGQSSNTAYFQVIAPTTEVIVDDQSSGFSKYGGSSYWYEAWIGYNGHMFWTTNNQNTIYNSAKWQPNLSNGGAGYYAVYVYIPSDFSNTTNATYTIFHNGITDTRSVNQNNYSDQWVLLGNFYFSANGSEYVELVDKTGETFNTKKIGFDAVKWVKQ
ncbi:IPT/TIG domain-containing protein [Candidatus Brocadia sinica]|uniref:Fibronectin type-III domain-containing protein n=2 Tax=Candidatus Brocadia TaxID=380240 RepID=A0ABQ0JYV7_9BACT|nr:IPT/TIG domain-containing protein [Candidatus Brocadia sinica]GAN33911.1 hypothetical protein BROSI_A2446 [Candidatus Brocadia sinica JPN1]